MRFATSRRRATSLGLAGRENIDKASGHLIALSNGFTPTFPNIALLNVFRAQHISDELDI